MEKIPAVLLNTSFTKIILPSSNIIYQDDHHSCEDIKLPEKLPEPTIELFEELGKNDFFYEYANNRDFAELFILLYPEENNSSILLLQKILNTLIIKKSCFQFQSEYLISQKMEEKNLNNVFASIGSLHYFYLLFYDWLNHYKESETNNDYEDQYLSFFIIFKQAMDIVYKNELYSYLRYPSNYFLKNSQGTLIFQELDSLYKYFLNSKENKDFFKFELEDYEVYYLSIVKKYLNEGIDSILEIENLYKKNQDIKKIANTLSIEKINVIESNIYSLWQRIPEAQTFLTYVFKIELLLKLKEQRDKKNQEEDEDRQGSGSGSMDTNSSTSQAKNINNKKTPGGVSRKKI